LLNPAKMPRVPHQTLNKTASYQIAQSEQRLDAGLDIDSRWAPPGYSSRRIAKSKTANTAMEIKKEPQRNNGNDVIFSSLRCSVEVQILVFVDG